jgi:hypothetical protein
MKKIKIEKENNSDDYFAAYDIKGKIFTYGGTLEEILEQLNKDIPEDKDKYMVING